MLSEISDTKVRESSESVAITRVNLTLLFFMLIRHFMFFCCFIELHELHVQFT